MSALRLSSLLRRWTTATPVAYASLRYLVDECLSPRLCALLIDAGHDAVHVGDRGLLGAPDDAVIRAALAESRTVVSADTDFGELLAASGAPYPSVVLFRRQSRIAETQAQVLLDNLLDVQSDLDAGAVVVLAQDRLRVRRLPLHRRG